MITFTVQFREPPHDDWVIREDGVPVGIIKFDGPHLYFHRNWGGIECSHELLRYIVETMDDIMVEGSL